MLRLHLGFDDDGIEKLGDNLLLGLGQTGDSIELLFEMGSRAALAGQAHGGLPLEQLVERNVESIGEPGEQVGGDVTP